MAEIIIAGIERRRPGSGRAKRHSLKTDMTPMVDLGFLLITFFVMTVQLSKPAVIDLAMPIAGPPTTLGNSNALTVLLDDNDRIYYYHGNWEEALANKEVVKTNLSVGSGLGKVIREKQKWLDANNIKDGRTGLMLLIKAGKKASYENVINALDETMINIVKKYAVLPAGDKEAAWMNEQP